MGKAQAKFSTGKMSARLTGVVNLSLAESRLDAKQL